MDYLTSMIDTTIVWVATVVCLVTTLVVAVVFAAPDYFEPMFSTCFQTQHCSIYFAD